MEHLTAGKTRSAFVLTCSAGWEQRAKAEVRLALSRAQPPIVHEFRRLFLKGNLLLECEVSEERVLALLAGSPSQALARVIPVQVRLSLAEGPEAFTQVAEAALAVGYLQAGDTFLVRCQRRGRHTWQARELEKAVALALEQATGAAGDYSKPTKWLVSVQVYQDLVFVGVYPPQAEVRKEVSLQRKYAPGERPVSRAEWKLKEAFEAFGLELPPGARVLDIGAAPGGWTRVLSEMAGQVVAVDPAPLNPTVAARPNVLHFACRAEQMAEMADQEGRYDLLANDMNLDPAESAAIMCRLARLLKPGASAIMTVKLMTPAARRYQKQVAETLASEFEGLHFRRLPHNAKEITVAMRRKQAGA